MAESYCYQVGGSLAINASSYLVRACDQQLYSAFLAGELCYVFSARQMGKSSLRVQMQCRLQQAGVRCAYLDLTSLGRDSVTPEVWYRGLMLELIRDFGLFNQLDWRQWWSQHAALPPVQQLRLFLQDVLLTQFPDEQLLILVDEIDCVLGLSFPPDDLFALIRSCYEQRLADSPWQRLNWGLFGVVSPTDLIRDRTRTPFNIGFPIELRGFRFTEARPLAKGLAPYFKQPEVALKAILKWTAGQPFLTQKLCKGAAMSLHNTRKFSPKIEPGQECRWIDKWVRSHVIQNWQLDDHPQHFGTICDRLLRNENQSAAILSAYRNILTGQGKRHLMQEGAVERTELLLSGLVECCRGYLRVTNRIYETVFDVKWIDQQLAALRPYALSLTRWQTSGGKDSSRLLRGRALKEAKAWSQGKRLSDLDCQFLSESEALVQSDLLQALKASQLNEAKVRLEEEHQQLVNEQKNTQLKRQLLLLLSTSLCMAIAAAVTIFSFYRRAVHQEQVARAGEVKALTHTSDALFASHHRIESLLEAIRAHNLLQEITDPEAPLKQAVERAVQRATYNLDEFNRLNGVIRRVLFTPDGSRIVSIGIDKNIQIWERNGQLLKQLTGHQGIIQGIAVSPNGQLLASASVDKTIRLWSIEGDNRAALKTLYGHEGGVWDLAFSPDGEWFVSTGQAGDLKVWSASGELLRTIAYPGDGWASSVAIHPNGKTFATSSWDNTVRLFKTDGTLLRTIQEKERLNRVVFSPDGTTLATASDDRTVKLWGIDGQLQATLQGHVDEIWALAFSPDGQRIASGSDSHNIKLWTKEGILIKTLKGHQGWVNYVTFSPDSQILASASQDTTVRLWKLQDNFFTHLVGHHEGVTSVAVLPGRSQSATASDDRRLKLWQSDGMLLRTFPEEHEQNIVDLAVSADGQLLATASWDGTAKLWHPEHGLLHTLTYDERPDFQVNSVAISPDAALIATAQDNQRIALWSSQGKQLLGWDAHASSINGVTFSASGHQLLSIGEDRTLKVWQLSGPPVTARLQQTLPVHDAAVSALAISPEGGWVATASKDGTLKLWARDAQGQIAPTPVKILTFGGPEITSVAFSPKGDRLAAGSDANTLKLWTIDGVLLTSLFGHQGRIEDVAFSEDGEYIFSASKDKTTIRWNLSEVLTLDELQHSCEWLGNYLRHGEKLSARDRQLCQSRR